MLPTLRSHFAPLLLNDQSLTITYDGSELDPSQEVVNDTNTLLLFGEGESREASLRIIEWRSGDHRAVSFGPDADHFPYETSGTAFENQFTYSAYVTWDKLGIDELAALGLGDMAPDPVGELWTAAREAIRDHFNARRRERRREQVERWKETGIYPYKTEPTNETERAERAVFDVVSGTLVPHISKTKKQAQLTLGLLRDAIRHDPALRSGRRIKGDDLELGVFFEPQKEQGRPLVRAYVRRWRDVIDENKRRLEFMTNALEHDPSITEGLQYVRSQYEDLIPEGLRAGAEPANYHA